MNQSPNYASRSYAVSNTQYALSPTISLALHDYGGTGHPLVLLHGGGRNLCDWTSLAPLLTPHHHVIAMEFRSHGQSTPCDTVWNLNDALSDLEAVIAHLDLDNPYVAGHSLGGLIATLYGAAHPDCPGVVNIDGIGVSIPSRFPVPDSDTARQSLISMIQSLGRGEPLESIPLPEQLTQAQLNDQLDKIRAEEESKGKDPADHLAWVERFYYQYPDGHYEENPSARALQALSLKILDFDIFDVLPQVRCPLLHIAALERSTQSEIDPNDVMQLWHSGIAMEFQHLATQHPNFHYTTLQGDHLSILQTPIPLSNKILAFTTSHS